MACQDPARGPVAVIMAGGRGERFWPKSRPDKPKQFLALADGATLLQSTFQRLLPVIGDASRILVVTGAAFASEVHRQLPELPPENVLAEPCGRDTAACVGLAALEAIRRWDDPVVCMVPADHAIWEEQAFAAALQAAVAEAAEGRTALLGLTPTRPEVGYGYIRLGPRLERDDPTDHAVFAVDSFVEKPARRRALAMVASGRYLWNCGIFVLRARTAAEHLARQLPGLWHGLCRLRTHLGSPSFAAVAPAVYEELVPVSFDRGVLESASDLCVVRAAFPWDDVGSWLALERLPAPGRNRDGNVVVGEAVTLECRGCIVDAPASERLVVLFGVSDLVVVDTDDAVLVARKSSTANLKLLVSHLKDLGHYPA